MDAEETIRFRNKTNYCGLIRKTIAFSDATERDGRIHSVFEHAVNLSFSNPDGYVPLLLTCTVSDEGLPDGAVVSERLFRDLADAGRGTPVILKDTVLLSRHFREKMLPIPCLTVPHRDKPSLSKLNFILRQSTEEAPGIPDGYRENVQKDLLHVAEAVFRQQLMEAESAAVKLIGFGSGLTPGADDAMVGMMAVLKAIGCLKPFLSEGSLVRTTDISAKYLRCAQEGAFTRRIVHLFECCAETDSLIHSAAENISAWGASSGRDMLWGLRVTLDCFLNNG